MIPTAEKRQTRSAQRHPALCLCAGCENLRQGAIGDLNDTVILSTRIPRRLSEAFGAVAGKRGLTRSELLQEVVERFLS